MRGRERAHQHGGGARQVVGERLCDLVLDLDRYEPLVQSDAPDAVHSMRVTMRRLRSNLATYRPLIDPTVTDPLRDELKWFGGVLGEARDAEVLWADLIARLQDDPPRLRGHVTELVDSEMAARYRHAHDRCVAVMASGRYAAMLAGSRRLGDSPPWADGPDPDADVLLERVRHDWRRLEARVAALAERADEGQEAHQLHDVRKAAKRVRYGVEPLVATYGEPAEQLTENMKQVQDVLGGHQDAVVAADELVLLSARAAERQVDAFELGRLHEQQKEDTHEAAEAFKRLWRTVSHKRYRRWLSRRPTPVPRH